MAKEKKTRDRNESRFVGDASDIRIVEVGDGIPRESKEESDTNKGKQSKEKKTRKS